MRYRLLGRTGLEVSEVGYGAWGIGKQMWKGGGDEESMRSLNQAVDRGVNFFDTALAYGDGHSERLIGRLLKQRSEELLVATKIPPKNLRWPAQGTLEEAFPRQHIIECTEASLRNLDVEALDVTQLHVWNPSWIDNPQWHETLSRLRDQGKIRYFGVSINDHAPETGLELVDRGLVDTVQAIYNIFDQSPEDELFPLCGKRNVGVIVRVPFDEGALTGKIRPDTDFPKRDWRSKYFAGDRKEQVWERVRSIAEDVGIEIDELPELALRFCLHPSQVSSVIPGMRKERHVDANTAVSELPELPEETLKKLRKHRWEKNFYP